jgi:DNA sulfur modification protein DndE
MTIKPPIETIRISQKGKEQVTKLVRYTGIQHRNIILRWAYCTSLAELSKPPNIIPPSDSNFELTWRVFAGVHEELYAALTLLRAKRDGVEDASEIGEMVRVHLHRGIGYLSSDIHLKGIRNMFRGVDEASPGTR